MSTAFVKITFDNKRLINGWTFTSSVFEITEMCGETVEFAIFFAWNLLTSLWKPVPFLWNSDFVKKLLNYFPKRFLSLVCSSSTLFCSMFFTSWGNHTFERMLYCLWWEIELVVWPRKQMVCSTRLTISSRDKGGESEFLVFSNFNHTLDKDPPRRESFSVFFAKSHQ